MKATRSLWVAVAAALALSFCQIAALAQDAAYPNRPIKMLVGFGAGGGTDIAARIMAQKMSEILGQSIVVENRTGASGMIAAEDVAKSPPDGYTLMMGSQTTYAVAPNLYRKVTLDRGERICRRGDDRRLAAGAGGQSVVCRAFGRRTSSPWPRPIRARSISAPAASAPRRI